MEAAYERQWTVLCRCTIMVTTNLPQLVHLLHAFAAVSIHDHQDTIELHLTGPSDLGAVDDLLCDALFVDPVQRQVNGHHCVIQLHKRDHLRHAGDMDVHTESDRSTYVIRPAA